MSYIGKIPATGNFVKLDAISVVNGQAAYTMQSGSVNFSPESANHMLVSLNGIIQNPGTSFTIAGSTITFASALSTGDVINFIMVYGNVLDIGTPSDNTVTASKLTTDSVIEAKIQNDAVTRDKINAISTSSLPSFEAKGTPGQTDGYIQLNCEQNSHGVKIKSPPHSAGQSYTLTLPQSITNDYFLKTDGSGNLSFAEVSSDFTKIAVTGSGTDVSYVSIPIDRANYVSFDIYWKSVPTSDGAYPRVRYRNSSGAISSSNYKFSYVQTQGSGGSISSEHTNASDHIQLGGNGGNQDLEGHGFHLIYTPHLTSRWGQSGGTYNGDMLTWQGYRIDENDNWRDIRGAGKYDIVEDGVTHIDIYYNSGNVAFHNYAIYGRKA